MKQQLIESVRNNLQSKRIVLFGAGQIAKDFYENYGNTISISFCVSNLSIECGAKAFMDVLDVREFSIDDITEDTYIIVCGNQAFNTIELQLSVYGLKMYDNYVESAIAAAALENKKIALFYGQCILRDTYNCLIQIPAFTKEYFSIFTTNLGGQAISSNRLLFYAKDLCDLYVYSPKVIDRDKLYNIVAEDLPEGCIIHSVPNLQFPLYWPQINIKAIEYNEFYFFPCNTERNITYDHTLYRRSDENINKMLKKNMSVKEIVDTLSDENFYSEKIVNRWRDMTFKLVGMGDNEVTIKIMDYMEQNYRKELLFQNFLHPHKDVIWAFVKRLLNRINISTDNIDYYHDICPKYVHHGGDVPIYPSVIKNLKLECIDYDSMYEVMTGSGIENMNFREYTEHFAEYTLKTMKLKEMLRN